MKTIAGGLVLALVLIAAGAVFWSQSQLTRRVADAHLKLATLRYDSDDATDATTSAWDQRRWQMGTLADDVTRYRATLTYWLGRYQALTPLLSVTGALAVKDSSVMFAAANAAYRTSNPEAGDHKMAVERLDSVLQAYADLLRLDPSHADAAYNYEYVARVRDAIAKGKKPMHGGVNPTDTIQADLPVGPTVHGRPGAPPPEINMGEFKTLTPMKFEEREEQAEPGRGTFQRRRG
jgi:hypothetical protein